MADKTLFGRLKKLFAQSTVVRKIGDGKLKVVDPSRAQSVGNLATNMLVDRYNRLHATQGGSHVYDPNQGMNQLRQELFKDYEAMDNDSIISAALDVYADECTLKNEYGDVLEIKSGKTEIQEILHNLFYDVLNIEFNLYPWIRMMCKYGDFYLQLHIVEKLGVTGCNPLSPYAITRQEGIDPARPEAVEFIYDETYGGVTAAYGGKAKHNQKIFENYEVAHFRLLQDTNFVGDLARLLGDTVNVGTDIGSLEGKINRKKNQLASDVAQLNIAAGRLDAIFGGNQDYTLSMLMQLYKGDEERLKNLIAKSMPNPELNALKNTTIMDNAPMGAMMYQNNSGNIVSKKSDINVTANVKAIQLDRELEIEQGLN